MYHAARLIVDRHGNEEVPHAAARVDSLLEEGDAERRCDPVPHHGRDRKVTARETARRSGELERRENAEWQKKLPPSFT